MKKTFSVALALVLVFCSLSFVGCKPRKTDYFNYNTSDLTKYVSLDLSEFSGRTVALEGIKKITREDALREFRYERLFRATYDDELDGDVYTKKPGWGDYAQIYYDLTATPGGQSIASNLFNAGSETVMIGYWEFYGREDLTEVFRGSNGLFYNETLSDGLMNIMPASRRTSGNVSERDVLRVSFTIKKEDGTKLLTKKNLRIDTAYFEDYEAVYGTDFVDALFSHAVGSTYSVNGTYKYTDEAGKEAEIPVVYEDVKIMYVAQESYTQLAIPLAADAFDETYGENFRALNGKTVYLNVCIDYFIDYDVPEFDLAFLLNEYGYVPPKDMSETDDIMEAALLSMQEELVKEQKTVLRDYLYNTLYSDSRIKMIPEEPVDKHKAYIVNSITSAFESAKREALANGETYRYTDINVYAADYVGYSLSDYPTLEMYAKETAVMTVKERLFIFAMAQLADCRLPLDELDQLYEEYFLELQQRFPSFSSEEILEKFDGEEGLRWYINWTCTIGYLTDYIYENNTWVYEGE